MQQACRRSSAGKGLRALASWAGSSQAGVAGEGACCLQHVHQAGAAALGSAGSTAGPMWGPISMGAARVMSSAAGPGGAAAKQQAAAGSGGQGGGGAGRLLAITAACAAAGAAGYTLLAGGSGPHAGQRGSGSSQQQQPQQGGGFVRDPLIEAALSERADEQSGLDSSSTLGASGGAGPDGEGFGAEAGAVAAAVEAAASAATAAPGGPQGLHPGRTDPELAAVLTRRALSENRLRGYLQVKQRQVQTWLDQMHTFGRLSKEEFEKEMRVVEDEVNLQTSIILYGVADAHARRNYLQAYGCSKWSEEALQVVGAHSPLLEVGAGLGHWQRELAGRGVDIVAVDNYSQLPTHDVRMDAPQFVGKVEKGDESAVSKYPRRTLLLVYPGPEPMAAAALAKYKGNTLLYVGESRGGVNATPEFFDALERDWECVRVVPVEPFPEGYEKLWVLQRKKRKGWLW